MFVFFLLHCWFSESYRSTSLLKRRSSNSGIVLGTVTDKANAVVPDATVDLVNTATNDTKTTTTGASGQYIFPNVSAGTYTLKISKPGFATITFANLKIDITKSYTYDATLEVSSGKEVVEVSAAARAELQTTGRGHG